MNTKYLQNQNGQIVYEDTGSGPLVVCVPSLGDVRSEYRFLAPRLVEAGYRVLCMDVRGHGESSTEWDDFSVAGVGRDLLALIRAQDAGPAVVVSDSMAGGASVWAAAESPEWIAGLMLIDPVVRGEFHLAKSAAVPGAVRPSLGTGCLGEILHHPLPHSQTGRLRFVYCRV